MAFIFLQGTVLYYKIVKGEEFEREAISQHVNSFDVEINANRGSILDRNKHALAISGTVYNVILEPRVLVDLKEEEQTKTINALSEILNLNGEELWGYIEKQPDGKPARDTYYLPLAKKIPADVAEQLEERKIKGVNLERDTKRNYVHGTLASKVIGFISGSGSGYGLETRYNDMLIGTPGRRFITYGDYNKVTTQFEPPQDGYTIVTTLDFKIQQFAEDAVQQTMEMHNPADGAVIVMNPKTGEVLAMAASPGFDANEPSRPTRVTEEYWASLSQEEQSDILFKMWSNFNVSSTFEPGSIFKPLVAAAALEEGIITPERAYYCGGRKIVADRDIPCWNTSGHGMVNLEQALAHSCNIGFMDIGAAMGREIFHKYQRDFGIGDKTGIDLPAEANAIVYEESAIGPVELATGSMGQGFNCTPIQIINATCALINGGNLMKPYIVSQVIDRDGNIVADTKPQVVRKVVSAETADIVREALQHTIEYGTGAKAKIPGYAIGGKTGTGQQTASRDEYAVSIIAFLPVEDPQICVMVVADRVETYTTGVTSVVPIVKDMLEKLIQYMTIPSSYADDIQIGASVVSEGKARVDDYSNQTIMEATKKISDSNLTFQVVGKGDTVVSQAPKAGMEVSFGTEIILYVTAEDTSIKASYLPDVVGLSYDDAVNRLYESGFQVVAEGDTAGIVVTQNPGGNVYLETDSEIKIILER